MVLCFRNEKGVTYVVPNSSTLVLYAVSFISKLFSGNVVILFAYCIAFIHYALGMVGNVY